MLNVSSIVTNRLKPLLCVPSIWNSKMAYPLCYPANLLSWPCLWWVLAVIQSHIVSPRILCKTSRVSIVRCPFRIWNDWLTALNFSTNMETANRKLPQRLWIETVTVFSFGFSFPVQSRWEVECTTMWTITYVASKMWSTIMWNDS